VTHNVKKGRVARPAPLRRVHLGQKGRLNVLEQVPEEFGGKLAHKLSCVVFGIGPL
jgi:hypothetical protein